MKIEVFKIDARKLLGLLGNVVGDGPAKEILSEALASVEALKDKGKDQPINVGIDAGDLITLVGLVVQSDVRERLRDQNRRLLDERDTH